MTIPFLHFRGCAAEDLSEVAAGKVPNAGMIGFLRRMVKIAASLCPSRLRAEKAAFWPFIAHGKLLLRGLSGIKQRSFLGARFLRL
jgi:hypothetical protein